MALELWRPDLERVEKAQITAFRRAMAGRHRVDLPDYAALYQWSIEHPTAFWEGVWDHCGVIASERGKATLTDNDRMPGARWFADARLNFAENLLKYRGDTEAIVFRGEDQVESRWTHEQLHQSVSRLASALRGLGVKPGDRVAGYMPNLPETIAAALATASLGAVWCSGSPDFGVNGIVDRFGQIEPKVLFTVDGYFYNGKRHDLLEKLTQVRRRLPSLERVVVVPYTTAEPELDSVANALTWDAFTAPFDPAEIEFEQVPFDHPLYILFSSGTTGVPKCIVHGAGGTLLQHLKEHRLHTDLKPGDRFFYFTTCGWMMWNWLVSGLASGATLLLYDGSPFYPDGNALFDFAQAEDMSVFGTSAKYIDALRKAELEPARTHKLGALRTMLSTGSPLAPESFDFVYQSVKQDLCLSSITGGTDIISCFAPGNPVLPVYRGELQSRGLGMAVEVWDDTGQRVVGEKGELVCVKPFPSMPVAFWNDDDGSKYRQAYFDRFPNVWCHGDYVELTERGTLVVYGRSDAVLNPGGVRIGTAEIYRQVEQLDEVLEALVIGQDWDHDVRVVLFVQLRDGCILDQDLQDRIRRQIRVNATPRHVPARIVQVQDIPRTKSGKIVELAVREVVHGRPIKNTEALANPEALAQFKNRPELLV